jgi:anion-transporting  ArsA/GET3 family ATPase
MSLAPLLSSRRVILCAGCGGVGKTTTTAALGLAAARRGKNVLCLTIDPAKRLAQSLGLEEMTTSAQRISPEVFAASGIDVKGSLTVMMLDTKSTFDGLVKALAPTPEQRDRILSNVLYRYVSTSLAGTQEYMAMEKLYAVRGDPSFDLVLLDTPPTTNALDFLDAPERLVGAIDSPAMQWFVKAFEKGGGFSINILARGAAAILRGICKLTGRGFLEQIATFVREINAIFGGWRKRADEVASALRGSDVAYVLVTSPDPLSIKEVRAFAERLREQRMPRDALVVNRVHPVYGDDDGDTKTAVAEWLGNAPHAGIDGGRLATNAQHALKDERALGRRDRLHLLALDDEFAGALRVDVPAFAFDVHDVVSLSRIADILAPR